MVEAPFLRKIIKILYHENPLNSTIPLFFSETISSDTVSEKKNTYAVCP